MKTLEERFWGKVDKSGDCWEWMTALDAYGYGYMNVNGKMKKAHRISWDIHNGSIPEGIHYGTTCVLHRCDNPSCVNPSHLFLGTQAENIKDMNQKGRQKSNPGEANGFSKLTAATVKQIRKYYAAGGCDQKWLAQVYGLGQSHISRITRGEAWAHL